MRWEIDTHVVTAERGESGKFIVRIDGRVAAKPMGEGDDRRDLIVGGVPYTLMRAGETFDLVRGRSADAETVLAHSDTPLALEHARSFVQHLPIFIYLFLVVAVVGMVWYAARDRTADDSKARVERLLREMAAGTDASTEIAVRVWARNGKSLDGQELAWAARTFPQWRKAKEVPPWFNDYKVTGVEVLKGEHTPTAIVTFTVNGKDYKARVPKDLPISWAD